MATATVHRGLRDMKIAAWSSTGSWGTAYDIYGAREMTVELVVDSDELLGDDVVIDRYTKVTSARFRFANGAVDLELLDILTGGTLVSNASYEDLLIDEDDNVPYVGIAGRVMGSAGTYDQHVFAFKCKISGNLQYQAQVSTYLIPQVEFQAVQDGAVGIIRWRKFVQPTALEIPLRTTTGGL